MTAGYVKLWRDIRHSDLWTYDAETLKVFLWLLTGANWKPGTFQGVEIQPGQIATSVRRIAEANNISEKKVRTILKNLAKKGTAKGEGLGKQFSVITICNWQEYQSDETEKGERLGERLGERRANEGRTKGERRAIIEEGNKGSIEEGKNNQDPLYNTPPAAEPAPSKPGPKNPRLPALRQQAESIYQAYPKKAAKAAALKEIEKALSDGADPEDLLARTRRFAELTAGANMQFIPMPSTFFHQGRWTDDESVWRDMGRDRRSGGGFAVGQVMASQPQQDELPMQDIPF